MKTIPSSQEEINKLYKNKTVEKIEGDDKLRENDIYIFKSESQSAITRVRNQRYELLETVKFGKSFEPLNLEQNIYMNYLLDKDIKCVVAIGDAGTGKTICAMAYAYQSMLDGVYQNVIISRPPVSASKKFETGFKPGTLEEKIKPWMLIFYDNLGKAKQYFTQKTKIELKEQSLEFIKGLSFDNSLVIIDEGEDLNEQEIKAIMTRIGEGSKLLLLGDEEQTTTIDSKHKLSEVIEKFDKSNLNLKEQKMFASIKLKKSVRSEFVQLVLKVLK